jgi:hypothetical protein
MCATYFDKHSRSMASHGRGLSETTRYPPELRVPSLTPVTFVEFSVLVPKLTHLPSQCIHTYVLRRLGGDYP